MSQNACKGHKTPQKLLARVACGSYAALCECLIVSGATPVCRQFKHFLSGNSSTFKRMTQTVILMKTAFKSHQNFCKKINVFE